MNNQLRSAAVSANPRVQAVLQDYLDRVDRSEVINIDALLAMNTDIADELRSFIAMDQEARRMAAGATPAAGSPEQRHPDGQPSTKAEVSTHSLVGGIEGTVSGKARPSASLAPHVEDVKSASDLPDIFGRYRIQKKLGSGAMGAVYLADDTLLHRKVALKTPTFENDTDGELLKRFYREARAVANLKHPNLCAVYDVGEIEGRHYISMEFVRGKKLQDYIKPDKPMAEKQAMAVVRKIAPAMHESHSNGVIHRDLKPDNIMVNEKGEPVVMDFGLVHTTDSKNSTRITQRGMLVGSPAYMSKEQVEGDSEKLTGATDQYSLGVILYQLLTSKLPFEGGIHGVLAAILTKEPVPPSQLRPDVNPHLEAVCLKMMSKEAMDRYPSMKAVADAILEVSKGTSKAAGSTPFSSVEAGSMADGLTATFAGVSSASENPSPSFVPQEPARITRNRRPGGFSKGHLIAAGLPAGMFLLLSIIFWIRSGNATVKVTVNADDVEVTFQNKTISIVDGIREYTVAPGEHVLHIKSKDAEFDTEKFTLKRGENPAVIVEIDKSELVARLGNDVITRRLSGTLSPAQVNRSGSPSGNQAELQRQYLSFAGKTAGETRVVSGQTFVWCPPGTFRMGTSLDEAELTNHGNPVEVTLTHGFWLSTTEATQVHFEAAMKKTPWKGKSPVREGLQVAATCVDHHDAMDYCIIRSQIERDTGVLPEGWEFSLPTEAQWEYACRAGTVSVFSFGDDETKLADYGWFGISRNATELAGAREVGQKRPNQWGLFDMSGNVWEWCSDWHATELVGGADPIGPQIGTQRVIRGGSWQDESRCARVGLRNRYSPVERVSTIGFRVAIRPIAGYSAKRDVTTAVPERAGATRQTPFNDATNGRSATPPQNLPSANGNRHDYESIATGNWVRIVDASTPLPDPAKMSFNNGVLELRSATLVIDSVAARNVILRAKVNKISGGNAALSVRQARYAQYYSGYYVSGNTYGMGKSGAKPWSDYFYGNVGARKSGFFEMAVSMVDDTLTLYADGKTIYSVKDTEHERGSVNLIAHSGISQFRDVEVMVLDPVSAQNSTKTPKTSLVNASIPQLLRITDADDTTSAQASAWVSADGLRIYWEQLDKPDGEYQIWQAERANADQPFGNKRVVGKGRQPTLTPDELQIVFSDTVGQKFKRLYSASRKTTSVPFGSAEPLPQFGDNICNSPSISADGLSMTTNARPLAATTIFPVQYLISRRKKLTEPWSAPVALDIRWDAVAQQCPLTWIAMADDELSFLATHELDLGRFQVVQFTRSKTTEPFEKFTYLSLPGVGPVHGRTPRYIPATKELFLTAPDDYSKATTLAGWQDDHRPVIWVIRKVELSSPAINETDQTDSLPNVSIPSDTQTFSGHSYKFFREQLTWKEAKAKCEALGGNLVVIDDVKENQFVANLIAANAWLDSWIGITDEAREGTWLTVDGTVIKYTNWHTNQPNNAGDGEHFAIMSNQTFGNDRVAWRWCDQPSNAKVPHQAGFVCEWNLLPGGNSITKETESGKPAKSATVFNGRDLTGWTPMLTTGESDEIQSPTTVGWEVKGREIVCATKAPGWLRLDRSYGDCEFEFEFFMPANTNSGLLVRYAGQGPLNRDNKCEVQLLNVSEKQPLDMVCGAIHSIVPAARDNFKPGRWNEMTVRIAEEQLSVRLNDEVVVDVRLSDHAGLRRLPSAGHFGLYNWRGEASGCRFRNIRVKDLENAVAVIPKTPESDIPGPADSRPSADSASTTPIPASGNSEAAASDWIDLLEWSEGIDWKSRGYDWNENCEGTPGKAGITLKPTKGLQNIVPLPAIIDGDYDMEVEFTRHEGHHSVETFFPVGTKNLQLLLGANSGTVEGIFGMDGKNLLTQGSLSTRPPFKIGIGVRHRLAIRVRQPAGLVSVEVDIDDQRNYFKWSGPHSSLDKAFAGRKLTMIRRPWIASYECRVTFEEVRMRMTSGTIRKDFITQADRDADLANGFVRLVGEPAIKPVVSYSRFCVNQIPMEVANGPEGTWPLINREFSICQDFYGAHAPSRLKCPIPRGARSFTVIGYNDGSRSTQYVIHVDGKEIYTSGIAGIVPIRIDLPRDATLLELLVETGGNPAFDCSYWCYPRFHSVPVDKVTDRMLNDKSPALKFKIDTHTVGDDKLTHNQPFTFCRSVPLEHQDAEPCDEFLYSVPNASVTYAVPDGMTRFAAIGYCVVSHSVRFEVWADTKQIFASPQVGIIPIDVKLPPDTKTVELKINDLGNSEYDNAMWCFPRLYRK